MTPINNVQEWFDAAPDGKREMLVALRKMVRDLNSRIVEEIKWSRPCYSINGKFFCYLFLTKNHVTLGFEKGSSLTDPGNFLEGSGKELRHIKFHTLAELDQPAIQQLIKEALNF